jgi:hypothetical protein
MLVNLDLSVRSRASNWLALVRDVSGMNDAPVHYIAY